MKADKMIGFVASHVSDIRCYYFESYHSKVEQLISLFQASWTGTLYDALVRNEAACLVFSSILVQGENYTLKGGKLLLPDDLKDVILSVSDLVEQFKGRKLSDGLTADEITILSVLLSQLDITDPSRKSKVSINSKLLHILLPDLIPPINKTYMYPLFNIKRSTSEKEAVQIILSSSQAILSNFKLLNFDPIIFEGTKLVLSIKLFQKQGVVDGTSG